jgi:hypothetical protein
MQTHKSPRKNLVAIGCVRVRAIAFKLVKWPLQLRLVRRCTIWCPTWTGSSFALLIFVALAGAWFNYGESYLAFTQRSRADILVVEGWIGRKGVSAAADEFKRGDYHYIVCTGGLTSDRWEDQPASFAELAAAELIRLGIPKTNILVATAKITESHRTFASAVAVWRTLQEGGIDAAALNVFTLGPHARRSALVFSKVNSPGVKIGVIGWVPSEYKDEAWWQSSDRSRELLDETVGYLYELLLDSGRRSNSPQAGINPLHGEVAADCV